MISKMIFLVFLCILLSGRLSMVRIEHDNTGFHPAWFLTSVEVINLGNNVNTVFSCNQWLDMNRGDGQITRDLFLKPN